MSNIVRLDTPGLEPPPPRPEPELDHMGRYKIPDPETGEERRWTRATTWAKTVADLYGLGNWEKRMVAYGLSQRPDLVALAAAVLDPTSKQGKGKLDRLAEQAKEYAKSGARANLGTALHSFAEAYDLGQQLPMIPPPWDQDIVAYRKAMAAVEVSRNYIEKVCVLMDLGVAGTMDRIVRFKHSKLPMVGDLKTGTDLKHSWGEIAIQLALYAHADHVYDLLSKTHTPMLQVDKERALVAHLPAGEARCTLYIVDIAAGWEMAQVCGAVREWRNRKDLAQVLVEKDAE